MRKINRLAIYTMILSALLLHLTVLNRIAIFGSRPDLLLICVIFTGLFLGKGAGFESGFAAGLLTDLLSSDYFGINTLVLCATGFFAGALSAKFFRDSKKTQIMLVFCLTLFSAALNYFASRYLFSKYAAINWGDYFLNSSLSYGIYTTLISVPIFSRLISFYNLRDEEEFL